jgi:hypothetical protein
MMIFIISYIYKKLKFIVFTGALYLVLIKLNMDTTSPTEPTKPTGEGSIFTNIGVATTFVSGHMWDAAGATVGAAGAAVDVVFTHGPGAAKFIGEKLWDVAGATAGAAVTYSPPAVSIACELTRGVVCVVAGTVGGALTGFSEAIKPRT